ncbi:type III pantothenate kinase [Balneolales bacterium ANBcel1]|nr:type III pantothenate kinase [Balneolales bacterium ANBcel1]
MNHTLFMDIGNSRIKAADFVDGAWRDIASLDTTDADLPVRLQEEVRPYRSVVVASVRKTLQPDVLGRMVSVPVTGITRYDIPSEKLAYRSVDTLGVDRYLACLGAWSEGRAVIVTDAGTACTIDVMDQAGVYRGGVIMPGLHMLIRALGGGADGLFDVEPGLPESWPPDTTDSALKAGTTGTFLAAWYDHVRQHQAKWPDAEVWITGGDAGFLIRNSRISANHHPHLVFEGMRKWMDRNRPERLFGG